MTVWAQQPNDYTAQARALDKQVAQLEERYLKPALLRSRYQIETRFNDAKVAYLLEDYSRASILFVGLVDNPEAQNLDSYREALFLLADSLFKERNFLAARRYFREIVSRGPGRFYQESITKLLELAAHTGEYDGVDELYDSLEAQTELSATVHYVRGKTLYSQGRHGEARRFFERAAQSPQLAMRSQYFRGVSFAAQGQYDNAREVYEQLLDDHSPASDPDSQELIDLIHMALGRLAYEEGDYDVAIDYYQRLKRTSDYFDQMLYELTWTFIAQEKYQAASRVADVFLYLSNPDPTFVPRVKLLKADLHLRLQQYERAELGYHDVVSSFQPVAEELEGFVGEQRDLETFFVDLVEAEVRGERPRYLPTLVQQWIEGSEVLDKARLSVSDLIALRSSIETAVSALEQMEARLGSGARIQSFPELADGMTLGVEIESRLIDLRRDMLQDQYQSVASAMTPAEQQRWEELDEDVARLRKRYEAMPKTRAEVRQRAERIERRFGTLRRDLDEITFEIDSQQEVLDAIDGFLESPQRHDFDADQLAGLEQKRADARRTIAELRELQRALRQQVDVTRQQVGVGDEVSAREQAVRNEYREMLTRQRELIEKVARQQGQGDKLREMRGARQRLSRVESRLQGFFGKMNDLVGERTEELRRDLASERKMLTLLDAEVAELVAESKQVTAQVAYYGFQQVQRDFRDLIMRGDIGLVDVAWQRKEDTSREINQLFEDRTAELKMLQEAFEEVR